MESGSPSGRTLAVLSHPNHEAVVYGLWQRWRPFTVYLSDGGAKARVEETRRGLDRIGLGNQALYLNYEEALFYRSLVDQDVSFFLEIIQRLKDTIVETKPDRILVDAVEFYNPVHDLSLALLGNALREGKKLPVFEIPLVRERRLEGLACQSVPKARESSSVRTTLTDLELANKKGAWDDNYKILGHTMGHLRPSAEEGARVEVVFPAGPPNRRPEGDTVLRYDVQGGRLAAEGKFKTPITWGDHFIPLLEELELA